MSNAIKYTKEKGKIDLVVEKSGKNVKVSVIDNGIGIPNGFDHSKAKSLGIQLIHILADQVNGELSMEWKKGTKYELTFSV